VRPVSKETAMVVTSVNATKLKQKEEPNWNHTTTSVVRSTVTSTVQMVAGKTPMVVTYANAVVKLALGLVGVAGHVVSTASRRMTGVANFVNVMKNTPVNHLSATRNVLTDTNWMTKVVRSVNVKWSCHRSANKWFVLCTVRTAFVWMVAQDVRAVTVSQKKSAQSQSAS